MSSHDVLASPENVKDYWKITVNSVMQGVKQYTVHVPEKCTVQCLKVAIEMVTEVSTVKQVLLYKGKEMKNNDSSIEEYGIKGDDSITMNIKMSTGMFSKPTSTDMIFLIPTILPENQLELRKTIKGMNSVGRRPKKMSGIDENAKVWTPEKQLEAELTRNRMKTLLRRKKAAPMLSMKSPNESETGSAQNFSPVATPPSEMVNSPSCPGVAKMREVEDTPVTEKELKLFFDPPETMEEFRRNCKNFYTPPQNESELQNYEKQFEEERKTKCNACFKKLSAAQQTMQCKCKKVFCDKHRRPQMHTCMIDYKQDGRSKLKKENSKVVNGGARKAKFSESERA